jgi:hypothetical protein
MIRSGDVSVVAFHRVLKHRPVSDERAVLFWLVAAEPRRTKLTRSSPPANTIDEPVSSLCAAPS